MKLLFTGNSPYARRVRVALREAGLMRQVDEVDISPRDEHLDELLAHGPGGKVPVLVTDTGQSLCESLVICTYLNTLCGGKLYPKAHAELEAALCIEGVASVLLDSLFVRSRETRRDKAERSQAVIDLEADRASRCYDKLESLGSGLRANPHNGLYCVVTALGYANWRHAGDCWRASRPALSDCYDELMQRESLASTAPVF
jgi:glutathione S-transferase